MRLAAGKTFAGIDASVKEQALALFRCALQALCALNNHVELGPQRTTFEIAQITVDNGHWSRVQGGSGDLPPSHVEGVIVTRPAMPVAGQGDGGPVVCDANKARPGFRGAADNAC